MPAGFRLAITNPPYLARHSATRRGLTFPVRGGGQYEDLYAISLDRMLKKVPYVAAIIPESFITSGWFRERLSAAVSLTSRMFEDTACPVCLALFVPDKAKGDRDFTVWAGDRELGRFSALSSSLPDPGPPHVWRFNDPEGGIGLRGVDDHKGPSIRFVAGSDLDGKSIKHTSRALTRIGGVEENRVPDLIEAANAWLTRYRIDTEDALLTAFRGLRADGRYRRRLDFAQARQFLDLGLALGPPQAR